MKKLALLLMTVLFATGIALAQRTIQGKVSDAKGEPMVGTSVVVKGTTTGTTTDVDGNYNLSVPVGSTTIIFSFTGFQTQEVTLGTSNVLDLTLQEGILLSETVVTALGISKSDKSLGFAVTKVSGETVANSGEANLVQALASKGAGILVTSSAGVPGASSKIILRGNSSFLLDNQPLIVIDNVPYDNSTNSLSPSDYPFNPLLQGVNESNRGLDINPKDVESITLLKGPSAAALYGTRAANGVILITTKKGQKGLQVSYGALYDMSEVNKLPKIQNIYGQGNGGGTLVNGAVREEGALAVTPNSWGPKAIQTFDNFGNYFQKASSYNNNLAISGGSDKVTFRFSYGNNYQTGIVPNTFLKRNTFRLGSQAGTDVFKIDANIAYSVTEDRKAQNGSNLSGVMLPLLRTPIDFNLIGGNGTGGYENLDGSQHTYLPNYDNPFWTAYHNPANGTVNRFTGNVQFTYMPNDWLKLNYRIGTDMYNDARQQIFDIGSNNINNPAGGELFEYSARHEEINSDIFAIASKKIGDLDIGLTVGNQLNQRFDKFILTRGRDFGVPGFFSLSNVSSFFSDNIKTERRLAGVFGSLDLGYKNTYYLTVSGRNDWASTFGPQAKSSFFYPSVSGSVVFSEWLTNKNILSFGKLRLSYARAGREPFAYSSRTVFTQPFFADGFTNGIGFPYLGVNGMGISNTLGNAFLRPEIRTSYEAGVDLKFIQNRFTLGLTYYYDKSTDLLVRRPLASTTGSRSIFSNVGEMENRGYEVELGADILDEKKTGFGWNITGNWAQNKNKVLKLAEGVSEISLENAFTGIGSYAIVGQPYGAFFGTKWQRDASGALVIGTNGLPVKDPTNQYIGNPNPKWTAGIRNTFSFKGLSLTGLLDVREGSSIWGGTIGRLYRIGRLAETANRSQTFVIDGVKADGSKNTTPISPQAYYGQYLGDNGSAEETKVYDASWVRLREATLSYTLPKVANWLRNATIYATGRNLWLKTDYLGVDPETSLTGAGSQIGGFDYFNMPSTKSLIFGLRADF